MPREIIDTWSTKSIKCMLLITILCNNVRGNNLETQSGGRRVGTASGEDRYGSGGGGYLDNGRDGSEGEDGKVSSYIGNATDGITNYKCSEFENDRAGVYFVTVDIVNQENMVTNLVFFHS